MPIVGGGRLPPPIAFGGCAIEGTPDQFAVRRQVRVLILILGS
jgi:hypothetical protein